MPEEEVVQTGSEDDGSVDNVTDYRPRCWSTEEGCDSTVVNCILFISVSAWL